ncbi:MAG: hydantoinase/oxoprolinase family protein [Desulfovibrio sp.]|jgi:N-methylhydantoinase A/oxoprolinase/acetone carboxylase beta subunit|nr:hydantoinase/oxoprolinase family protein [Desulfovibrio sp.]
MLIGLDVGGTYTDAVLLDENAWQGKDAPYVKAVKAPTQADSVLPGVLRALEEVLEGEDPNAVKRVCVSSTLGLNALLTGREDPTGVLAVPGPGMDPALFWGEGDNLRILSGAEDHRGIAVAPLDPGAARQALRAFAAQGIAACAVVGKFSPKNPEQEYALRDLARQELGPDAPVACGSDASGALNFPRRLHTAYCNASLTRTAGRFASALDEAAKRLRLNCPIVIMKADAGVFSNAEAAGEPAAAMGSGPAASLMGVLALLPFPGGRSPRDLLMVDMGGTSTDLALLAHGQPLLAREGLRVAGRPTLIRSLWTRSIALGGDSVLAWDEGKPRVGPDRLGPALALAPEDLGQRPPTLTDALVVLGRARLGRPEAAQAAMDALDAEAGRKDGARAFVDAALDRIRQEAESLLAEVNTRPVYTIRELLVTETLAPEAAVLIGGPAGAMAPLAETALGMPVLVPPAAACANALGAALARPTRTADLYADTLRGRMSMTALGIEKSIDHRYGLGEAKRDILAALAEEGCDPAQLVFAESFRILDERQGRGSIIKIRAQRPAGLLRERERP